MAAAALAALGGPAHDEAHAMLFVGSPPLVGRYGQTRLDRESCAQVCQLRLVPLRREHADRALRGELGQRIEHVDLLRAPGNPPDNTLRS